MTESEKNALLPAGLRDVLPFDAAFEAEIVETLVRVFGSHGYDRVKPPLIEFEDGLLSGAGVAVAPQTFRLMDPVSQRMMGVRADITPQVARIARTRLAGEPRPLRLSYAGDVLRVRGTQLRPERQLLQVGAELIGSAEPTADAEIIAIALEALAKAGIAEMSVDLTVPRMVPAVFKKYSLAREAAETVRHALDRKDAGAVEDYAGDAAPLLLGLLDATGSAELALKKLAKLDLPDAAVTERDRAAEIAALVSERAPDIQLTLDPVEHRGFEYHTGLGFTVFAPGVSGELASGGRYRVGASEGNEGERATGVTLYVDTLLKALETGEPAPRVFIPLGTDIAVQQKLRDDGWVTVSALKSSDEKDAARDSGCTHILEKGSPVPLGDKD